MTVELSLEKTPLAPGVAEIAAACGEDPAVFAVRGGEDYELCLCASPASRPVLETALAELGTGVTITWLGTVLEAGPRGARFLTTAGTEVSVTGFEHSF